MHPTATPPRPRPPFAPGAAGIGLRAPHHAAVLAGAARVGWLEVHAENHFAPGGGGRDVLARARERWPLSLHGVGLSLGSTDPLDREHLARLKALVRDFEPELVSEHACWGRHGGVHYNDLFPLPYTTEALLHLAERVRHVQDVLGRRILVENVSSYVRFRDHELEEWEFLAALVAESGCGLLLDVNNVHVSARNHGFDAREFLAGLPRDAVGEIHVAGHARVTRNGAEILIDTHGTPVCDDVWELYAAALARFGDVPTLVEWDTDVPALDVLVAEAHRADEVRRRVLVGDGPAPARLRDLQSAFVRAIDGGDSTEAGTLIVANGLPAADRLGIYANNVAATFRQALELSFPAVARLVGAEWFASAARAYRRTQPSRSGDLQAAGAGYAAFLAERLAGTPHEVVADVASLEWAREEASIAADAEALDLAALQAVPADRHGDLVFTLHPSVRCVGSRYPVVDVWSANVGDGESPTVDLNRGAQHALVYRHGLDVHVEVRDPAAFAFIEALAAGETLAEATSRASAVDREFPLVEALTHLAGLGLLSAARLSDGLPRAARSREHTP